MGRQARGPRIKFADVSFAIEDGVAAYLGEDVFAILQKSADGPQSAIVTRADLHRMLAIPA